MSLKVKSCLDWAANKASFQPKYRPINPRCQGWQKENPVQSCLFMQHQAEARPEQDPVDEAVSVSHEEQTQPTLEEDATHCIQETDPDSQSKLNEEEKSQPPIPKLKTLPHGLKYAFLHNNSATLVVIRGKLTESETRWLVAVLEKYWSVIGYPLQDFKVISKDFKGLVASFLTRVKDGDEAKKDWPI